MNEQELKEWQAHYELLKEAYQTHLFASSQKEKDVTNTRIQKTLEWGPFADFCYRHNAPINNISRHGVDYYSEQCINMIDKIAKGEMSFEY